MVDLVFSIIIPTFNSAKTLKYAIESILNQKFNKFEILILDGASLDDTLKIAQSFNDDRIRVFSEKDKGIYDAMNKGIKLAKGEWIYFLGSDDLFYDDTILDNISKYRSHSKIIYGNVLISGDAGWANDGQIYDGEFSLSKLIETNICHQAIFYNKCVFETCGLFNDRYNVCADWDLNLKLRASFSYYFIDTIVAIFHGGNTSHNLKNNYTNHEKWTNILSYYRLKTLTHEFSNFSNEFLMLSKYYFRTNKYFKSLSLLIIYYFHKIRIQFIKRIA
jgi:glycosyltransferase involved in cell wall biosynthesis